MHFLSLHAAIVPRAVEFHLVPAPSPYVELRRGAQAGPGGAGWVMRGCMGATAVEVTSKFRYNEAKKKYLFSHRLYKFSGLK